MAKKCSNCVHGSYDKHGVYCGCRGIVIEKGQIRIEAKTCSCYK